MAIVFLPTQPTESTEYMVGVDAGLIAAVDRWRAERAPGSDTGQAIEALLRTALATEGFFDPANQSRKQVLLAAFQEAANGKSD